MKQFYYVLFLIPLLCFSQYTKGQSLVHYWNFNTSTDETTVLTPTSTIIGSPSIVREAGGSSLIEVPGTGQNFNLQNLNARNGDASGDHLRFNNPGSGGRLLFSLPTTGFGDIVIKYATRRSSATAAAETQLIEYSVDGVNFSTFTTVSPVAGDPTLTTLDFSAIADVDNNSNFKVRISFLQGSGGVTGNHRFDNFTVDGTDLNGDTSAPTVAFQPADATTGVFIDSELKLTFNEDVRMIDNSAIDHSNVMNVVELRESNAEGTLVPFTASVAGKTITISPVQDLKSSQQYYLALKENTIEDLSNNVIATVQTISFTTLEPQTLFAPGDLLFVAYRMNATSTDDEIALVTFVNILPGTLINFTDAKFTDNAQAQCTGGFTWKAPAAGVAAGTVISIKTDAALPNIGSTNGTGGFGLSSGGDQIMVYTGTPANPTHITALSSNLWIASNTSCSGSNSKIPGALVDGQTAINLSSAPGNVTGNTVNAFYNGLHTGSVSELKAAIINPANWVGVAGATAPQVWPSWSFPGPPSITKAAVKNQSTLTFTFSGPVENTSATSLANYTGITGLTAATLSADSKEVTLTYGTPFTTGQAYSVKVTDVAGTGGLTMFGVYTFEFTYVTKISFQSKFVSVDEGSTAKIDLKIENPSASTITLVAKALNWSTADQADHGFSSTTLTIDGNSELTQTVSIPVNDDIIKEQDEYLVFALEEASGISVNGSIYFTLFIKDNDSRAPVATKAIELQHKTSYASPEKGTAEIVVHDPVSDRLFVISSVESRLDIADFSNPTAITHIKSIDMTPYGAITSVAVYNGIVAVASPNADPQLDGSVVFFDSDGQFINKVTVGALPDMITFTKDGAKVLTANEGQPNDSYSIDPEGSVSIIDISGGVAGLTQANVNTLLFDSFNASEGTLITAGVRKLKSSSTLSQDFEPEFITVSSDSKKAWVTLQENNAIAELNLETNTVTSVWPMGKKDFAVSGSGFDASDNSGVIAIANWPVKGFYIPDAIANYTVGNTQYLVTANEGDEKEYGGLNERTTVGAVTLDPTIFPNAAVLKENHNLGRLRISKLSGDTDADGDYDELNMVGGRSFTIWNASTHERVFDSGDQFEQITASDPTYGALFNADNEGNGFKSRSRAKGPEPEGLTIASFNNKVYAFVSLERVGGVMVYDITDPADVKFVDYKNNRSTTEFTGDHGPEGIVFVSRENSPDGKRYILVANEISGTVSVYEVVGKDDQVITFNELINRTMGDAPFSVSATSDSGLPVAFQTTDDEITITGSQVTLVKPGRVTIQAIQEGNEFFKAAPVVGQSFCVRPVKPSITLTGEFTETPTLTSSSAMANQWYRNGIIIDGATSQTHIINSPGVYSVNVWAEDCESAMSDQMPIIVTDLEVTPKHALQIHPNPALERIQVTLPGDGRKEVTVLNSVGRTEHAFSSAERDTVIDVSHLSSGYYFVQVRTTKGSYVAKFIKH